MGIVNDRRADDWAGLLDWSSCDQKGTDGYPFKGKNGLIDIAGGKDIKGNDISFFLADGLEFIGFTI